MSLPPNLQLVLRHGPGGNHHRVVTLEADFCLSSELFSDLRLETPDGVVGCHQTLLAPLSPLLSSILASYPPFPGLVHTVVLPIKVDIVKSVLKIIYTGNVTLPSQEHVDQVLSGLKLLSIHLPGLQCYRAAGRAGHYSHVQASNNNIEPLPLTRINQSSSHFQTSTMQLPTKPVTVMEDVKPVLLPPPDSPHDQPVSLDKLRVLLAKQLLPLGIGESTQCNVEGCTLLVTLSTLTQHFKDHKELDCRVFKCDACGKGFKQKKSLEIHRIEDHEKYFRNPLFFSTEEPAICAGINDDPDSPIKKKRRRVSLNEKVSTKVTAAGPKAPLMCALVEPGLETPLICTLCQAPLSSEWYRHPRRHNCPHSTPRNGSSSTSSIQPQCSICSTPVSSAWYLPPSRHVCSAVFASTSGQIAPSTSKRRRFSTPESFGRIKEIEYSCVKCSNNFPSLLELRAHYTASHYWEKIEAQFARWGSRCFICLRDFNTSNNLVKHLGNFHSYVDQCLVKDGMNYISKENTIKLQSLECGFCGEMMSTSSNLKNHLSYVHFRKELGREFPEDNMTNNKEKKCNRCGKMLNSDPARIRHMGSYHDQVLKYAKHFIAVTDDDAKLIPENDFDEGLNEAGEPFEEDQMKVVEFLTVWEPLDVSKIPSPGAIKTSTPLVETTTREHRETDSSSSMVSPELTAFNTCPLTNCTRKCTNKTELRVHLAMSHYKDELEKEYGTGANMDSCKMCEKILPNNKLSLLKHIAVDHEVVMMYVERDMALEAELEKAVDNLEVTAADQCTK